LFRHHRLHLRGCFLFHLAQRLDALLGGLDVMLAFDASHLNLLSRGPLGFYHIAFLRFIDHDPLKLFLFIEKV
jgi:hypothetical protein